jgi:hypothetical protein
MQNESVTAASPSPSNEETQALLEAYAPGSDERSHVPTQELAVAISRLAQSDLARSGDASGTVLLSAIATGLLSVRRTDIDVDAAALCAQFAVVAVKGWASPEPAASEPAAPEPAANASGYNDADLAAFVSDAKDWWSNNQRPPRRYEGVARTEAQAREHSLFLKLTNIGRGRWKRTATSTDEQALQRDLDGIPWATAALEKRRRSQDRSAPRPVSVRKRK